MFVFAFLLLILLITFYKMLIAAIIIDYDKVPNKKIIDYKEHSIQQGFPGILKNWRYILSRLLNFFYHILAKKLPLSRLRVTMHRCRGVTIGKNVSILPNVSIDSAFPNLVFIGNNVTLSHNVIINAHSIPPESFKDIMESYTNPVVIENDSWIGINVIILPGVRIGKGAHAIAGSIVDSDVEPYTIVRGNPAKVIAKMPSYKKNK